MERVSKGEFYKIIGPLDVVLTTVGNYPYTTIFKLRNGKEVGRSVSEFTTEYRWPVVSSYYLTALDTDGDPFAE